MTIQSVLFSPSTFTLPHTFSDYLHLSNYSLSFHCIQLINLYDATTNKRVALLIIQSSLNGYKIIARWIRGLHLIKAKHMNLISRGVWGNVPIPVGFIITFRPIHYSAFFNAWNISASQYHHYKSVYSDIYIIYKNVF